MTFTYQSDYADFLYNDDFQVLEGEIQTHQQMTFEAWIKVGRCNLTLL